MGFSSNISLYYTGKVWDLDYDIKEFLNDNLWGVESLEEVEKFLHSLYKHDTDLNVVAIDNYTNQILVYLDPIGLKSLYVNDENLISSSIEALRNDNSELDYQYLGLVRKFGYNQNNLTPYKNIKRLLPGYMYKGNLNTFYFRTELIKVNSILNTGFMLPLYITESIRNRLNHIEDKVV
jgi:asparagine synthetase B (glutamine-hydrolysing)